MKLSDQVCTLTQAKRLQELGITAPATFWWGPVKDGPHGACVQYGWTSDATAPAYNVAELGQMIGADAKSWFDREFWCCGDSIDNPFHLIAETEASARAAELISQLETNSLTAEEANKRLNQ